MYKRKRVCPTLALSLLLFPVFFAAPSNAVSKIDDAEIKKRKILIHKSLLRIYKAQNRVEEALKEFPIVISLLPQDARLHYEYGLFLLKVGKTKVAEVELRKASMMKPTEPNYAGIHGKALIKLGDYLGACKSLNRAIQCGGKEFEKDYEYVRKLLEYKKKQDQYRKKQREYRKMQELQRKAAEEREEDDNDW